MTANVKTAAPKPGGSARRQGYIQAVLVPLLSVLTALLVGAVVIRDQRACELLDVVSGGQFAVNIPGVGAWVEGIQDHVAAARIVEPCQVSAVGVGDHRAVAAGECAL